jgi:hypothetical protein
MVWPVRSPLHPQGEADGEQQLPAQRVEEPAALHGVAGQVGLGQPGRGVQRGGERDCGREAARAHPQQQWQDADQHEVQRQDVEVAGLVTQRHRLHQRFDRVQQEGIQRHHAEQPGIARSQHRPGKDGTAQHEHGKVGGVQPRRPAHHSWKR